MRDIASVSRNYDDMKAKGLIAECDGCQVGVAILPTLDTETQKLIIYVCVDCKRELCPRCGVRAETLRSPCCNLKGAERRPCLQTDKRIKLLLPCSGFDRSTRDPTKGCRRAIPASQYYEHIAECGHNLAQINNPIGDLPEALLAPPTPPEMEAAASGEENWNNDNDPPAPARNMYDAINNAIRNPAFDIAVPSWAVSIAYGSRSARRNQKRKRKRMRQAFRLS